MSLANARPFNAAVMVTVVAPADSPMVVLVPAPGSVSTLRLMTRSSSLVRVITAGPTPVSATAPRTMMISSDSCSVSSTTVSASIAVADELPLGIVMLGSVDGTV